MRAWERKWELPEQLCEAKMFSSIAQSVEHAAVNRAVVGSSPTRGVKNSDVPESSSELF